jgi:hypothetical protein
MYSDTMPIQLLKSVKFEYYFKNRKGTTGFNIDGLNYKSVPAYELYGDYWHGNPNTIHKSPQVAELRYKMTMETESILKLIGIKVVSMWEDE